MLSKFVFFTLVVVLFSSLYIVFNPSYQKSIQAKYYFEVGEYKEALTLANEAFSLDLYNRMASTIKAQSIIALKYKAYNNDAKKYMATINEMAKEDVISDADRAKIRLICQVMISSYKKLAPSIITDDSLVNESAKYYNNFEKLLDKVNR
jgi:hypothetical protein